MNLETRQKLYTAHLLMSERVSPPPEATNDALMDALRINIRRGRIMQAGLREASRILRTENDPELKQLMFAEGVAVSLTQWVADFIDLLDRVDGMDPPTPPGRDAPAYRRVRHLDSEVPL